MDDITRINRDYYDRLYRHNNPILHLLHAYISFDQQVKSRANHGAIGPIIEKIIREKGRVKVLDYGSGWGVFLLSCPKATEVFCYDISPNATRVLQSSMQFLGRTASKISIDEDGRIFPNDFDLISCSHVLEHVESDHGLLEHFAQSIRPGGYVLINVPINEVWNDPKHIRSYDSVTLSELMVSTGFKILNQWEVDKWTGFLLKRESARSFRWLTRPLLRAFRGFLTLLPDPILRLSEDIFLAHLPYQQLIMLGQKDDPNKNIGTMK